MVSTSRPTGTPSWVRDSVLTVLYKPESWEELRQLRTAPDHALAEIDHVIADVPDDTDKIDPRWLLHVYQVLTSDVRRHAGLPDDGPDEADVEQDGDDCAWESDEDQVIGRLFAEQFATGVPHTLLRITDFFAPAISLSEPDLTGLLRLQSVQNGGELARELARYGLTPPLIVDASVSMGARLRRFLEDETPEEDRNTRAVHRPGVDVVRSKEPLAERGREVSTADLANELERRSHMPPATASSLANWFFELGFYKPNLLPGFVLRRLNVNYRLEARAVPRTTKVSKLWAAASILEGAR